MGWKTINGRRYYYRSVREGNRVRSVYVGQGDDANLIARAAEFDRNHRQSRRDAERFVQGQAEAEDRAFTAWFDRIEEQAQAALVAAGYHRHHRGEWRKRRVPPDPSQAAPDRQRDRGAGAASQ